MKYERGGKRGVRSKEERGGDGRVEGEGDGRGSEDGNLVLGIISYMGIWPPA